MTTKDDIQSHFIFSINRQYVKIIRHKAETPRQVELLSNHELELIKIKQLDDYDIVTYFHTNGQGIKLSNLWKDNECYIDVQSLDGQNFRLSDAIVTVLDHFDVTEHITHQLGFNQEQCNYFGNKYTSKTCCHSNVTKLSGIQQRTRLHYRDAIYKNTHTCDCHLESKIIKAIQRFGLGQNRNQCASPVISEFSSLNIADQWKKIRAHYRQKLNVSDQQQLVITPKGVDLMTNHSLSTIVVTSHSWEYSIESYLAIWHDATDICNIFNASAIWFDCLSTPDDVTAREVMIKNMAEYYADSKVCIILTSDKEELDMLDRTYHSGLPMRESIYKTRWWSRMWTLQEAILPKKLYLWTVLGPYKIRDDERYNIRYGTSKLYSQRSQTFKYNYHEILSMISGRGITYQSDYWKSIYALLDHDKPIFNNWGIVDLSILLIEAERSPKNNRGWEPIGISRNKVSRITSHGYITHNGYLSISKINICTFDNVMSFHIPVYRRVGEQETVNYIKYNKNKHYFLPLVKHDVWSEGIMLTHSVGAKFLYLTRIIVKSELLMHIKCGKYIFIGNLDNRCPQS